MSPGEGGQLTLCQARGETIARPPPQHPVLYPGSWQQVGGRSATVQPQQSPGAPEGAMRRRRVEIRQLHSSEAGEALTHLLQVHMDFYIFLFGID